MLVAGQVASLAEELLEPPSRECMVSAEKELETFLLDPTDINLSILRGTLRALRYCMNLYPRDRF